MKLTSKQKALACTVGLFAGIVAFTYIVEFIFTNVSTEVIGYVGGTFILLFFAYMIYQIMLSRFEYLETLDKLVDKK